MRGSSAVWKWLESVDGADALADQRPAKRARHEAYHKTGVGVGVGNQPRLRHPLPPSPSPSPSLPPGPHTGFPLLPPKPPRGHRSCDDDGDGDGGGVSPVDATPRPRKTQLSRGSSGAVSQSSCPSSSDLSRSSSPAKQFRNAELQSAGFRRANLVTSLAHLPPSLASLIRGLTRIQNGEAILPQGLMPELAPLALPSYAFHADDSHAQPTPRYWYPQYEAIDRLLHRAAECDVDNEGESSWNLDVHGPVLQWVLRDRPAPGPVEYRYCTAARILRHFLPLRAVGNMVDFCLVVCPDPYEQVAIDSLCKTRPSLTINHTDWGNMTKHPIALSIKTKRQGEQLDEALVQIGTWHSSQWRSIRYNGRAKGAIEFLPAIIIHGHDWLFVATTLGEHLQPTIYSSLRIGDTSSAFGIYKLVAALQSLTAWCETVYWPAFKAEVLGFAMSTAEPGRHPS